MPYESFFSLGARFGLSNVHPFSQEVWRAEHYTEDPGTLCSGLTSFWLAEKICSRSPMTQIEDPGSSLLDYVKRIQALSYYPNFPVDFTPGEREKMLLARKYGLREWNEIRREVNEQHQSDFILFDLSRMFGCDEAVIRHFDYLHQIQWPWPTQPANSVALCVLRYRDHGLPMGHRIAYYFDRNCHHHFFDPNNGEVICPSTEVFFDWLNAFFSHTCYKLLDEVSVALYLLKNALSKETFCRPPPMECDRK